MKNASFLSLLFALCCLTLGCDSSKTACETTVSINEVLPNSNPTGYEVLLKTGGFTTAAKVVFGTVAATSRAGGNDGEIIATIPAGLSGNVEISVEEGDCIARSSGFLVLGALPGNVQPSLPNIIVPVPVPPPSNNIGNNWFNPLSSNQSYGIHLECTLIPGAGLTPLGPNDSFEYDFENGSFFDFNPVTGNINNLTNEVYLAIDRTAKPGGTIEKFDGQFIEVPDFLVNKARWTILLVSRETGRQLLINYPF